MEENKQLDVHIAVMSDDTLAPDKAPFAFDGELPESMMRMKEQKRKVKACFFLFMAFILYAQRKICRVYARSYKTAPEATVMSILHERPPSPPTMAFAIRRLPCPARMPAERRHASPRSSSLLFRFVSYL